MFYVYKQTRNTDNNTEKQNTYVQVLAVVYVVSMLVVHVAIGPDAPAEDTKVMLWFGWVGKG